MARMAPLSNRHNQEPQRSSTADRAVACRGIQGKAFFQTWASHPPYNARVAAETKTGGSAVRGIIRPLAVSRNRRRWG